MNHPRHQLLLVLSLFALASCQGGNPPASSTSQAGTSSSQEASSIPSATSTPAATSEASVAPEESEASSVESSVETPSKISLYRPNSRFVLASMNDNGSAPLATYHHADHGDAPYVEAGELFEAFSSTGVMKNAAFEKLADDCYCIIQNRVILFTLKPSDDTIVSKNLDYLITTFSPFNNRVGRDTCAPNDAPTSSVRSSTKSSYLAMPQDHVFDFGKYNFDFVEGEDGKVYLPFQPLGSLLFAYTTGEVFYNGLDFFHSMFVSKDTSKIIPGAYCSFYATKGEFLFDGDLYQEVTPFGNEIHRFAYQSETDASFFRFLPDGQVILANGATINEEGTPVPSQSPLTYIENEEGIFVTSAMMNSTFKIPSEKTYFNAQKRSPSVAAHTLDVLRFQFENIYGLKKELFARYEVNSIDELIDKKALRSKLLDVDSHKYDAALCEFILGNIDDGHTKYIGRSIFSGKPNEDLESLTETLMGPRRTDLFNKKEIYTQKRKDMLGDNTSGLFFEDETAILRFDIFALSAGSISNYNDGRAPTYNDIAKAMDVETDEGFYLSFEEIKNHSEIKNVIIDLTCNGGGAAPLLPYLAASWTDDPIFRTYDVIDQSIKEFHYRVDFNRNGIFGDEGDTYKGVYNFFLLISDFSFSCGNGLPTMAYSDGITLIGGPHGGGGACPVATLSDGSGTIFNTSMPTQIVYQNEEGQYINNDAGIPVKPECQLPLDSWYDHAALNTFVKGIVNQQNA